MKRPEFAIGILAGLSVTVALAIGHHRVGYVRDEGIYFEASRRYAAWTRELRRAPSKAVTRKAIADHFGYNFEHPPTMKLAAGLSARLLARPAAGSERGGTIATLREGAAMRLPTQILTGLATAILFVLGSALARRYEQAWWAGGALAAGAFVALPRVWFHAGLHTFDVPIAVCVLVLALCYRRSLRDARFGWLLGPLWGLALTVKHNALFVPMLLTVHYLGHLLLLRLRQRMPAPASTWVPWPFVSLAVLGPLTAYAAWPWLWHDPLANLGRYIAFHRYHSYYNMEFLGLNYNQPPLPSAYPWVMTWATVPSVVLVLALVGLVAAFVRDWRRSPASPSPETSPSFWRPCPPGMPRHPGLLLALFAGFPLALIALPSVPIFGGTKHWLTAYPFFAVAATIGWCVLLRNARRPTKLARLGPLLAVMALAPGIAATASGHPYNLSQYAPLVGGSRGAAELGLNRGFWGYNGLPLAELAAQDGIERLAPHDLHPLCSEQLRREGRWPPGLETVAPSRARAGLLFHERHMQSYEIELWNRLQTTAPTANITLHDVPLTSLYEAR